MQGTAGPTTRTLALVTAGAVLGISEAGATPEPAGLVQTLFMVACPCLGICGESRGLVACLIGE